MSKPNLERLREPCGQYLAGIARCQVSPSWIGSQGLYATSTNDQAAEIAL